MGDVSVNTKFYHCVCTPVVTMCMEHPEGRMFWGFGIYSGKIFFTSLFKLYLSMNDFGVM